MMLDRRAAPAGLLLIVALAGCGSHGSAAQQATVPAATSTSATTASAPVTGQPSSTRPISSAPAASSAVVASPSKTISIPAHLCSGTDAAQNAADAYMGALSAGNLVEAIACVLPGTVPEALTRSLQAKAGSTAVYLPRDGVDGPAVFGYRGNGKSIDVTVGKQPDGQFRVTRVTVRAD